MGKRSTWVHGKYNEKMFEFSLFTKYTNRNLAVFLGGNGEENKKIVFGLLFSLCLSCFLLITYCFEKKCIVYLRIKYYETRRKR